MLHICVNELGHHCSGNGLAPVNCTLRNKLQWNSNHNRNISSTKMYLKMLSAKWWPLFTGRDELIDHTSLSFRFPRTYVGLSLLAMCWCGKCRSEHAKYRLFQRSTPGSSRAPKARTGLWSSLCDTMHPQRHVGPNGSTIHPSIT